MRAISETTTEVVLTLDEAELIENALRELDSNAGLTRPEWNILCELRAELKAATRAGS